MSGVNGNGLKGKSAAHNKIPTRSSSHAVRELFEAIDGGDMSYRSICAEAGLAHNSLGVWKKGLHAPRLTDFENAAQVIGYRLTLEKIK